MQFFKGFLRTTFDIREGEYERVLLMQVNIFLLILTLMIIKPVVNAQFLSVIGIDKLPLVFVLVAISAMAVSTLYSRALQGRSLGKVTSATLIISIITLVAIGALLQLGVAPKLLLYLLYIGVAIFGVLTTSQFWIMANLVLDAREAKRLFSFIGAGAIAGGIVGGYFTSLLASFINGTNLLFVAALLLVLCVPLNRKIWKKHITILTDFQQKKRLKGFGNHPLWLIRKSRHLTYLALVVALGVLVAKLVEFQFSSIAYSTISDPDELTVFFGFWFSTFNVVSIIIQLFLTRRIVGTFGVGSSLFALPGGVLVGSVVMLVTPVLWVAVLTKLWEVSVKQSVNKAATELLALPIPLSIKSQTKSFIDVFVDLAATGVAGLCLIFLINGLDLSIRAVSILIIAVLGLWFWVAVKVRQEYFKSFKAKLTQADKLAAKAPTDFSSLSVLNGLRRALETGTEAQILYVLEKVREIPDKRLYDDVFKFLTHPSAPVRAKALHCIYYLEKVVEPELLHKLLHDEHQEVRYKAFSQLLRQSTTDRIATINRYLLHEDPMISGAALVGLSEEARNNPEMRKLLKIEQRVHEKLNYIDLTEDEAEKTLFKTMVLRASGHADLHVFYPVIERAMEDENQQIVLEAIRAAGFTMNIRFVERIASFLVTKSTRPTAQLALLNYGEGIISELEKLGMNPSTNAEVARQIPGVLEQMDTQQAVRSLMAFLRTADVELRLEALRSLNTMQHDFPHRKIPKNEVVAYIIEEASIFKRTLGVLYLQSKNDENEKEPAVHEARRNLINLLERRLDGTLERIFRLLGLRYPAEDVIPVYEGLKHINLDIRMNSVEFLENMLEPTLKKTLVPIAETAALETVSNEAIENLKLRVPDERACFELLLEGRDPKLKLAVFQLMRVLKNREHIALVKPFVSSAQPKVQEMAQLTLAELQG